MGYELSKPTLRAELEADLKRQVYLSLSLSLSLSTPSRTHIHAHINSLNRICDGVKTKEGTCNGKYKCDTSSPSLPCRCTVSDP